MVESQTPTPKFQTQVPLILKEVTYSEEEFKKLVAENCRIRYDIALERGDRFGTLYYVTLDVYGISSEGHIVIFRKIEKVDIFKSDGKPIEVVIKKTIAKLKEYAEKTFNAKAGKWYV